MKKIISISRKTDIPANHYLWLQEQLKNKSVSVVNPYNLQKRIVDLSPDDTHSLVLWSKDFKNVVDNPGLLNEYNLYFQYTITGYSKFLEPNVPAYEESIETLKRMLERYKPEQFNIRFDPIILTKSKGEVNPTPNKPGLARLNAFERLCKDLNEIGMQNCRVTTSYISLYGTVASNLKRLGVDFVPINDEIKIAFIKRMIEIAKANGRENIYTCSNPLFEGIDGIKKGACIDGELLSNLFGKCTKANDAGQRKECGCVKSIDIGDYTMKCKHGCKYCYSGAVILNK